MNSDTRHSQDLSITLSYKEWVLLLSVLHSIIEKTVTLADRTTTAQTLHLAHIREVIDRATD